MQVAALAAAAELEGGLEADPLVRLGVGAGRQEPVAVDPRQVPKPRQRADATVVGLHD